MNMGTAQVPTLSELEAEIERRDKERWGKVSDYVNLLMDIAGIDSDDRYELGSADILRLLQLTETQKVQAALRVLGEK